MMKSKAFVDALVNIAKNFKTLYVMGCFGAPMNSGNKTRYCNNHKYNRQAARTAMIKAATSDTFGFDCVCLIKGVLWGWTGDTSKSYGGAAYASNGVPDIGADEMIRRCPGASSAGWADMVPGEAVWLEGHIGVYIGDGLAVECTPKWENKVQITAVGNIGPKPGYKTRTWTKHGRLPYVDYSDAGEVQKPSVEPSPDTGNTQAGEVVYTVKAGDTLGGIAVKYGTTYQAIAAYNGIKNPNLIHVGQKIKIQTTGAPAAPKTYTVKKGDSLWKIASALLGSGARWPEIQKANGLTSTTIHAGQVLKIPD